MIVFDEIIHALQFSFFQRAIIVGVLIALSSSFLGSFLVLRKYSLIGDGLAHVSFLSVALALFLNQSPLIISIPIVTLASILILVLNEKTKIHGDAAIGLVASFTLALGVLIINFSPGLNVNIEDYLFGDILLTDKIDIILSLILTCIVILTIIFFYNPLFSITFDEEYAQVTFKTKFANYLLAILTSLTVVLGIRFIGTMLISSLLIFPTVTALQISKGFKQTIIFASIISTIAVLLGLFSSLVLDYPPGATIVIMNGLLFMVAFIFKRLRGVNA